MHGQEPSKLPLNHLKKNKGPHCVFWLRGPTTAPVWHPLYLVYHYTVYLDYTVYTLQWLEWKGTTNSVSIHSLHDRFNSLYNQTTDSESIRLSHMVHLEAL